MLIDFHTHAFPEKLAPKAMASLSRASGGLVPQTDGTLPSLKEQMALEGVDLSVVHCIATTPHQMRKVNDFAILANADPQIVAFGSVHPDAPEALEELQRLKEAGIKGIKLHPEYQGFYADDERLKPIYRAISRLGFITLFHAGHDYGFPPPYHGLPEHILGAKKWLDGPVVAAHWGGLGCWEQVQKQMPGIEGLYLDTSFGYGAMPRDAALAIVEKIGSSRLLFGSDMPWHRPSWELRLLNTLDLSEAEREQILHGNAERLLGI